MKALRIYILWAVICSSCYQQPGTAADEEPGPADQIKALEAVPVTAGNGDSLKAVWKSWSVLRGIQDDTLSLTRIYYNLARLYGMKGEDSAGLFIERAFDLIETTEDHLKEKALVYNGMGNILSAESRIYEASYYYNKAAAIVLSDTSVNLSQEARSAMLLSAAQSNRSIFQLDLADKMLRAALPICNALPEGHINHQRVLVQMIQTIRAMKKPADSIAPYLHKLEKLHELYPDSYDVSFLYEAKVFYLEKTNDKEALLHYQLLKMRSDERKYDLPAARPTDINNLFVDYCNIAATYILMDEVRLAETFLVKARQLKQQHAGVVFAYNDVYYQKGLAALYQKEGRKDEAIDWLTKTMQLEEDIYQEQSAQAVAEMNALYQLQAKDRSIRTLNESIKINELQLQQNRLWLIILVLVLVLLGVTLLFLYYGFRQRRTRQEREKVILQQQLLRTQMEPHFIFNTLSALQSFIRLDKKEKAIKYLNRFSRLLRSSLELSRERLVPLGEEIEALENYLSLQQMRFETAFTYYIGYPEEQDTEAFMIPPMLIQPYVENAILHGIDMDTGRGHIDIRFIPEGPVLKVEITDTGRLEQDRNHTSHRSLSGVISRERIQLLGKKAGIEIVTLKDGGTRVTLHIPVVFG